jgi:RNA polymerase sigma-70 factor (ECF subfamily)
MRTDNRSDEQLLADARRDATAFAELYDRHAHDLLRWLRRQTNRDAAQELLAETFAQAWRARRRYRRAKGPARSWLFAIAQHLVYGYYRRRAVEDRARRRLGMDVAELAPRDEESHERLDALAMRAELQRGLASLPAPTRAAVVLRVVDQLDYDELAARLGCSNQAARIRVSRGLRALRRLPSAALVPPTEEVKSR